MCRHLFKDPILYIYKDMPKSVYLSNGGLNMRIQKMKIVFYHQLCTAILLYGYKTCVFVLYLFICWPNLAKSHKVRFFGNRDPIWKNRS